METKVTLVALEHLDQLEEIEHRAGKPVDLVDHDHVDFAGFDIGQQPLQGRAFQRAAGEATIVVAVRNQRPNLPRAG